MPSYVLTQYDEELAGALVHAFFNNAELNMFVGYAFGESLDAIINVNQGRRAQVSELLRWADSQGKLDQLFVKAIERVPGNPRLRDLAKKLGAGVLDKHMELAKKVQPMLQPGDDNPEADKVRKILASYESAGTLEALLVRSAAATSGQDAVEFEMAGKAARSRVCSIGLDDTHIGTGFLIGPDRVMTNAHVLDPTLPPTEFSCVFGYEGKIGRPALPRIAIAESLARSEPREFDYHIVRLAQVPDGNRGHFKAVLRNLERHDPVSVLGHPNGEPMRFSFGIIMDRNSLLGRVAYTAGTQPGTSGAPVFAEDWSLVCLHHHGEKNVNNHGIPMTAIASHLEKTQKAGLLDIAK